MRYNLHRQANASLHSGLDLKQVVKLPPGEDLNEWIAVHGQFCSLIHLDKKEYSISIRNSITICILAGIDCELH